MKPNNIYILGLAFIGSLLLTTWGCEDDSWKIEEREWKLVWNEEFNNIGPPDSDKWEYETGANGWGNNELQNYTKMFDNVIVEDSVLKITAIRDGYTFTSGRLTTKGIFEQQYGRFEARIKLPYGPGIWPAFWMLGDNIDDVSWPQCGEIDIMEFRGQEPSVIHGSIHGPGYSGGSPITKSYGMENDRFDADYHVYAVEWGKDFIHYYVDDVIYQVITPDDVDGKGEWVYDHPFFIILNLAVGGNYVGFPTDGTPFPQTMYVDYVRVYQEK